jgi:outer membrane lipoprotein SlyB
MIGFSAVPKAGAAGVGGSVGAAVGASVGAAVGASVGVAVGVGAGAQAERIMDATTSMEKNLLHSFSPYIIFV